MQHVNDDDKIIHKRPTRYKVTSSRRNAPDIVTYHGTFKDAQKRCDLLAKIGFNFKAEII